MYLGSLFSLLPDSSSLLLISRKASDSVCSSRFVSSHSHLRCNWRIGRCPSAHLRGVNVQIGKLRGNRPEGQKSQPERKGQMETGRYGEISLSTY